LILRETNLRDQGVGGSNPLSPTIYLAFWLTSGVPRLVSIGYTITEVAPLAEHLCLTDWLELLVYPWVCLAVFRGWSPLPPG
jgi:hypothetical protein